MEHCGGPPHVHFSKSAVHRGCKLFAFRCELISMWGQLRKSMMASLHSWNTLEAPLRIRASRYWCCHSFRDLCDFCRNFFPSRCKLTRRHHCRGPREFILRGNFSKQFVQIFLRFHGILGTLCVVGVNV